MDDIKIIIWIIIGLIYLFSRNKKKDQPVRKPKPAQHREEQEAEVDAPAPKSFEELLREIEGMKRPAAPAPPPPPRQPEPAVIDYDEEIPQTKVDYDETLPDFRKEETYLTYEKAKAEAFARPSLEETVKLEDTIVRFKQFRGYEKESKRNVLHEYLQELKDPQGFKKAFVMSEILKPKF